MLKSRWRRWNDKAVLHLDYANFKSDIEGLRAEVTEADAEIQREPKGTVLVLIDLRDTVASGAVVQLFKESSAMTDWLTSGMASNDSEEIGAKLS